MTGAIGIVSKSGRNGGTVAHKDIAINFCYWLSPQFQIYLIKEFQRLKEQEAAKLGQSWSIQRILTRVNHYLQTSAAREHLVPMIDWNTRREALYQANEADMLNLIVFGMTAKEWRQANPDKKGNIRDHTNQLELVILNNLQSSNSILIAEKRKKEERANKLLWIATVQMETLMNIPPLDELKQLNE